MIRESGYRFFEKIMRNKDSDESASTKFNELNQAPRV
jgi:hypothetical protein